MSMIRRIFVEKKDAFAVEAHGLLADLRNNLGMTGLENIRMMNRYDVMGLSDEEFAMAKKLVLSEPPVDKVLEEELPIAEGSHAFAVELLPGQYDQREDFAEQCIQLITQKERPMVAAAKVYVLEGKLSDDMRPDEVLPFSVSKEKAVQTFMQWAKSKKYVPSNFFKESEVQKMTGVYYPHYVTSCTMDGAFSGEGTRSDVMTRGDYIITNTHHYRVRREGRVQFKNVMRPALQKANRKLSDGIHPYEPEDVKPYASGYLSGFLAEKRDVSEAAAKEESLREASGYAATMMKQNHGFQTLDDREKFHPVVGGLAESLGHFHDPAGTFEHDTISSRTGIAA